MYPWIASLSVDRSSQDRCAGIVRFVGSSTGLDVP